MSVQAMTWVLEKSSSTLGDRLVLYSIANHCDHEGRDAFPSVASIARESRLSERQVQRCIQNLQVLGELEVYTGLGRSGTNYFVLKKMIRPRCWYCGADLFVERTIDHQTPPSRGGGHDLANLVYACLPCNATKGAQTLDEYRTYLGTAKFFGEGEGRQFVTRPRAVGVTSYGKKNGYRVTDKSPTLSQMSPEPSENQPSLTTEPSKSFCSFWDLYPRKVGKAKAQKLWQGMKEEDRALAVYGLKLWRQTEQWHEGDGKFIPYASTFLAQRRWEDEPWSGAFEEVKEIA